MKNASVVNQQGWSGYQKRIKHRFYYLVAWNTLSLASLIACVGLLCMEYFACLLVFCAFLLMLWHSAYNSLRLDQAYICQLKGSSLVQVMACRLFSTKPLTNPFMTKLVWSLGSIFSKIWTIIKILSRQNAFKKCCLKNVRLFSQASIFNQICSIVVIQLLMNQFHNVSTMLEWPLVIWQNLARVGRNRSRNRT